MKFSTGSTCLACGEGTLERVVSEYKHSHNGHEQTFSGYITYACPVCHEEMENKGENNAIVRAALAFNRKVDGLLTPSDIRNIRTVLGYNQTDFAKILGVGEKSFARYETGAVAQGKMMDNFLLIAKEYPFVLNTLIKKHVYTEQYILKATPAVKKALFTPDYQTEDYREAKFAC